MDHLQLQLKNLVVAARVAKIPAKLFARICYRQFVIDTLEANGFNICKSAVEMGLHRNTLTRQIEDLDISVRALKQKQVFIRKSVASERPYSVQTNVAR